MSLARRKAIELHPQTGGPSHPEPFRHPYRPPLTVRCLFFWVSFPGCVLRFKLPCILAKCPSAWPRGCHQPELDGHCGGSAAAFLLFAGSGVSLSPRGPGRSRPKTEPSRIEAAVSSGGRCISPALGVAPFKHFSGFFERGGPI